MPHMPDEMNHPARFAGPVSPYRRGFEDCRYENVYCNPYTINSKRFWSYEHGFRDANTSISDRITTN